MKLRAYRPRRKTDGTVEQWCPACRAVAPPNARRHHECSGVEQCGPGCQLRRLLEWWGIRDNGRCGCDAFAHQMDLWGPAGCAAREEEILGHLAEAAVRRGLPFVPLAARALVRRAIQAAREEVAHAQAATEKGTDPRGSRGA